MVLNGVALTSLVGAAHSLGLYYYHYYFFLLLLLFFLPDAIFTASGVGEKNKKVCADFLLCLTTRRLERLPI